MKQKALSLFNKLKKLKKRNKVILITLALLGGTIYWSSLDWQEQDEIKAMLGSKEAKKSIAQSYIYYRNCKIDKWELSRGIQDLLEENEIDSLLLNAKYNGRSHLECHLHSNTVQKLIDEALVNKYQGDYSKMEDLLFINKNFWGFSDLLSFYDRNYIVKTNLIHNWMAYCESKGDYEASCLFKIIDAFEELYGLQSYGLTIIDYSGGIELFKRLVAITSIAKSESDEIKAKYLLASALLLKDENDSQAQSIIDELANKDASKSFLLLAKKYKHSSPELAAKYFGKVRVWDVWDIPGEFYEFYDFYITHPSLHSRLRSYDHSDQIYHLEHLGGSSSLYYADKRLRLAELYIMNKRDEKYDKAKEIYLSVLRNPNLKRYYTKALIGLGDIFHQGLGQRQDLKKAADYYGMACDLKEQTGCDKFRESNEKMH